MIGLANNYLRLGCTEEDRHVPSISTARQAADAGRAPPQLEVVISESALDLCRGMGDLGREQLQHMVEMAGKPNVEVRMVPWTAGFAVTAAGGAFSLLTFSSNTSDADGQPGCTSSVN